jgi:two-component system sensor histidine kinase KdpD
VTDEGPGIPPAEQARVFERFYRIPGGARGAAGSGLGLAIARGFVEASGGTVAIASPVAKGRGTTLTITLPLAGTNTAEEAAE